MELIAARAKSIVRGALVTAASVALTIGLGISTAAAVSGQEGGSPARPTRTASTGAETLPTAWRAAMLTQVNALRQDAGLAPLRPCASLRRAAQDYALLMAQTQSLGHFGPDGSAPWDRMRAQGFSWQSAAENLASGQTSIESVLRDWIESPDHLRNLLDPRMQQVGFGFAVDQATDRRTYWVQDFGRGTGC